MSRGKNPALDQMPLMFIMIRVTVLDDIPAFSSKCEQLLDQIWCIVLRKEIKALPHSLPIAASDKIREVTLVVWLQRL